LAETIRVQSPEGTKRICSTKRESASSFVKKVAKEFGFSDNGFTLFKGRNKTDAVNHKSRLSLSAMDIKHGDMLYLIPNTVRSMSPPDNMDTSSPSLSRPTSTSVLGSSSVLQSSQQPAMGEDEIDVCLAKQDGKIDRIRDAQLCRHGPMGRCVHCVPLEPFDEDYLNHLDPPVKHMSFHAYIRKLTGGADKGKFVALENISCKIKAGCEGHPLWPEGICTKCQPSAITLNRQKYRHVDNVMFENYTIADRFLNSWRRTGGQRLGYLYGRYAEHKDISLGIRAEIAAIYEPPQVITRLFFHAVSAIGHFMNYLQIGSVSIDFFFFHINKLMGSYRNQHKLSKAHLIHINNHKLAIALKTATRVRKNAIACSVLGC
uniref:NPL4 homolog, ubiquitin recognition factor n=1 Tax=Eptatretus burgeri TaxID=7764 RepID=A0A8C4NLG6_EPTBU